MAETATPSNSNPGKMTLSPPSSVQEISMKGDDPPRPFIVRNNVYGSVDTSPPLASIPTIDISIFSPQSSIQETEKELDKLRSALSSWGCFQVSNFPPYQIALVLIRIDLVMGFLFSGYQAIGHGMSNQFLDKVREIIKKFFALSIEEKQRHGKAAVAKDGYGLDSLVTEKQVLDWSDRLSVLIYPEDQRDLKLWPEKPQDFR